MANNHILFLFFLHKKNKVFNAFRVDTQNKHDLHDLYFLLLY